MALDLILRRVDALVEHPDFQKKILETINIDISKIQSCNADNFDQKYVLSKLRDAGIIDTILNTIDPLPTVAFDDHSKQRSLSTFTETNKHVGTTSLQFKLIRAKAFLDNLSYDQNRTNEFPKATSFAFYVGLHNQRKRAFSSSGQTNFDINATFIFNLESISASNSGVSFHLVYICIYPSDSILVIIF